ncbi:tetratricopeptide repeat protein [Methylobacter sp. BBA5.1]|jgi:predicted Zn-dependent protease|uniref:tetratricopeptide repeat protein n=1 Tax=Methylobacter sp. BBA5.1 TaxID=1495064 RepID=UPI000560A9AD|nr:tetratricopeptide repeat protein [Methylobacter sp. BBA5.1]
MRTIPEPLYSEVFELTFEINLAIETGNTAVQAEALESLRELYKNRLKVGAPDPFLTETLADCTTEPSEAAELYRLAIEQAASFPGEPIHTKQIGLARALFELGESESAQRLLAEARANASENRDKNALQEIEWLLKRVTA